VNFGQRTTAVECILWTTSRKLERFSALTQHFFCSENVEELHYFGVFIAGIIRTAVVRVFQIDD